MKIDLFVDMNSGQEHRISTHESEEEAQAAQRALAEKLAFTATIKTSATGEQRLIADPRTVTSADGEIISLAHVEMVYYLYRNEIEVESLF